MSTYSETIHFKKPLRNASTGEVIATDCITQNPDAWKSGYEQGKIEGENGLSEQLMKQRAEMHELLNGVVHSLKASIPQVIRDTESMVVSLALDIAQKLVGEIPISVQLLEGVVRDALAEVEGTAQMTIRLHPADLELLQNAQSPLLTSHEGGNETRFLGSPEVTRGGCLIQTRFGTVDARRETKFDLIKRSLIP